MKRLLSAVTLLVALVTFSIAPAVTLAASPAPETNTRLLQIIGTVAGGGTFTGTFNITRFADQNGQLVAVGTLTGTLKDALGNIIGTVTQVITLPVTVGQSTCTILELHLGPIDLNLLGLMVHLDQVNLVIEAQPGQGNLLGNLLCAIANLLNDGNPLTDIVGLLNKILKILG